MFCPNCGTENKEGSIYCNLCQEPLQKYAQEAAAPATASPGTGSPATASPATAPSASISTWPPPGMEQARPGFTPQAAAWSSPASPPYPAAGGYQPGYPSYPVVIAQAPRTPGEATTSLVLGIVGLLVCPVICSLLAIIFGIKARNMIDASGGYLGGRSVAQAGLILGIVGMALYTVGLIIYAIALASAGSSMSLLALL